MNAAFLVLMAGAVGQLSAERSVNFNEKLTLQRGFKVTPPNAATAIQQEDAAARITWTAKDNRGAPVGLAAGFLIQGNFEITAAYEFLSADMPESGYGVGVRLFLKLASADEEKASLGRVVLPRKGDNYVAYHVKDKTAKGTKNKAIPTEATSGKLRLTRTANRLSYLVSEDGSETFKEIYSAPIGLEDVNEASLTATSGGDKCGVDIRIKGFTIRADRIPADPGDTSLNLVLISAIAGGAILLGAILLIAWRMMRSRKRSPKAPPAESAVDEDADEPDEAPRANQTPRKEIKTGMSAKRPDSHRK